tara:strand:- start:718 stop:1242 length:525 start_codon:yes stop_codon:yes gene_type:complete
MIPFKLRNIQMYPARSIDELVDNSIGSISTEVRFLPERLRKKRRWSLEGTATIMGAIGTADAILTSMMQRLWGSQVVQYEGSPLAQNLLDSFNSPEAALLYQKFPTFGFVIATAIIYDKFKNLNENSGIVTKGLNWVGLREGKDLLLGAASYWAIGAEMNVANYIYGLAVYGVG